MKVPSEGKLSWVILFHRRYARFRVLRLGSDENDSACLKSHMMLEAFKLKEFIQPAHNRTSF